MYSLLTRAFECVSSACIRVYVSVLCICVFIYVVCLRKGMFKSVLYIYGLINVNRRMCVLWRSSNKKAAIIHFSGYLRQTTRTYKR